MTTRTAPWNWFERETLPARRATGGDSRSKTALSPMDEFHDEIDRLFQSFFRGFDPWGMMSSMGGQQMKDMAVRPRLDLVGSEKEYTVTVEVPGVCPDDINLEVRDGALVLRGEKKQQNSTEDNKGVMRMERAYGTFERVLPLPEDAQEDGITASHKDGVLTVRIQRKEKVEPVAKKIAIDKA